MDDTPKYPAALTRRTLLRSAAAGVGVVLGGSILVGGAEAAGPHAPGPGRIMPGPTQSVRAAITQLGVEAWQAGGLRAVLDHAHVHSVRELVDRAQTARELPPRLQLRLRYFVEHSSTDDFIQGPSDEVYLSALGIDSGDVVVGADGKPVARTTTTPSIGDVSEPPMPDSWRSNPYVLMSFDLRQPADWPRAFVTTLLIVEHDNEKLAESFAQLEEQVGDTIKGAAEKAAGAAAGALVGATIGNVFPGIGTAVGAAVGALAGAAYDTIVEAITDGLKNNVFTPRPLQILINDPAEVRRHPLIGKPQVLDVQEMDAHYSIEYDWFLAN